MVLDEKLRLKEARRLPQGLIVSDGARVRTQIGPTHWSPRKRNKMRQGKQFHLGIF